MMTRSQAAFRLSAERLWAPGFRVYFWTFTFRGVWADWEALARFRRFQDHLRKPVCDGGLGSEWSGVRVAELHPGGHGVHFHMLVNRRLSIWIVQRIASCYGIGRISVELADQNQANVSRYLSKYLSKGKEGPLTKTGRRARRWAAVGPLRATRVSDLVNDSPMWVFRRERGLGFIGYRYEHLLQRCWDYGEDCFVSAWYAARSGRVGDCVELANGDITAHGGGVLVREREGRVVLQHGIQPF